MDLLLEMLMDRSVSDSSAAFWLAELKMVGPWHFKKINELWQTEKNNN